MEEGKSWEQLGILDKSMTLPFLVSTLRKSWAELISGRSPNN